MDELDRCGEAHMVFACVPAEGSRRQCQHRAKPFATRVDQMRRHFGNAWGMFRGHALADQLIHGDEVIFKGQCQPLVRFR